MKMTAIKLFLGALVGVACTWFVMTGWMHSKRYPPLSERIEASELLLGLREYNREFGEWPVYRGGVLLQPLIGDNPRRGIYIDGGPYETDDFGRILNPAGVPYYFGTANSRGFLVSFHTTKNHPEVFMGGARESPKFADSVVHY